MFDDPHSFDILRDPNPHVGFGGGGAHFCVGANLAKVEIDLMFNAIADHLPDITQLGEPRASAPAGSTPSRTSRSATPADHARRRPSSTAQAVAMRDGAR